MTSHDFFGSGIGGYLPEQSLLGFSWDGEIRISTVTVVFWRLAGTGGLVPTWYLTCLASWGFCWDEASLPHCVGLFIRLPEFPHDMVAGFPCDDPGKHGRNITFLYDFALEVTLITSPVSYKLHRSAPLHVGGDHIGVSTRRQESWEPWS